MYGAVGIIKKTSLELLYNTQNNAFTQYNIASSFKKAGLYLFNPKLVLQTLRPVTSPAAVILQDSSENKIEISINCSNTAARIDKLVADIHRGSQDKALGEKLCPVAIEIVAKKNLAYRQYDKMIEKDKQYWHKAKSKKNCGEAGVLTVGAIREKDKEITAKELQEAIEKEHRLTLYDKGKFAQLVSREMSVSLDVFN
jgi:hypothetical protein